MSDHKSKNEEEDFNSDDSITDNNLLIEEIYQIEVEFLDKDEKINRHNLYFTSSTKSFTYQLKTFKALEMVNKYEIPEPQIILNKKVELLDSNKYFSLSTNYIIKRESFLNDEYVDPLPSVAKFIGENGNVNQSAISAMKLLQKYGQKSYEKYIEGQFHEYGVETVSSPNFVKALEYYKEGARNGELGCLIKLARIHSEPALSKKFGLMINFNESLFYLLRSFELHGFFDYHNFNQYSIKQFALFNIYMDCFPEFRVAFEELLIHNLSDFSKIELNNSSPVIVKLSQNQSQFYKFCIDFLQQKEFYNTKVAEILYNSQLVSKRTLGEDYLVSFFRAELMDGSMYALSNADGIEDRIWFYTKASQKGHKVATLRLSILIEALLRDQQKIREIEENQSANEAINFKPEQGKEIQKKAREETQNITTLNFHAHEILSTGASIKEAIEIYSIPYNLEIHNPKHLTQYYKLLKMNKDSKLFEVAGKISLIRIKFHQIYLGYCYEKGLGTEKNLLRALDLYRIILDKLFSSMINDSIHFIYYRIGIIIEKVLGSKTDICFKFCADQLLKNLKSKAEDVELLYDLARILEKGRGLMKEEQLAFGIYKYILDFDGKKILNADERFVHIMAKRKLEKWTIAGNIVSPISVLEEIENLRTNFSNIKFTPSDLLDVIEATVQKVSFSVATETDGIITTELNSLVSPEKRKSSLLIKRDSIMPGKLENSQYPDSNLSMIKSLDIKKMNRSITIIQSSKNLLERIYRLLEHNKRKNYNILKNSVYISQAVQKKITTIQKLILFNNEKPIENLNTTLEQLSIEVFDSLSQLNNIRIFYEKDYEVQNNHPNDWASEVCHVETSQLFYAKTYTFPIQYFFKLISDMPAIFHIPLTFNHPFIALIYAMSYKVTNDKMFFEITYFIEATDENSGTYFNSQILTEQKKYEIAGKVALIFQSFHMLKIGLFNFDGSSIDITTPKEIKLFNSFLVLFEHHTNVDHDKGLYKGDLSILSSDFFENQGQINHLSDVSSFGLWLFQMWTGKQLFNFTDYSDEISCIEQFKKVEEKIRQSLDQSQNSRLPQLPLIIKNLILNCLSIKRNDRPKMYSIYVTLKNQMIDSKSLLINQELVIQNIYRSSVFGKRPPLVAGTQCCRKLILPWGIDFVGELSQGLPRSKEEEGELKSKKWCYKGKFVDGLLYGNSKFSILKTDKESFTNLKNENKEKAYEENIIINVNFELGLPKSGNIEIPNIKKTTDISYNDCWIPNLQYRKQLIQAYNQYLPEKSRKNLFDNDEQNFQIIEKIIDSKPEINEHLFAQVPSACIDCLGNLFYCQLDKNGLPNYENTVIIINCNVISRTCRIYSPALCYQTKDNETKSYLLVVDPAYIELQEIEKRDYYKMALSYSYSSINSVRYYHFGQKFIGLMNMGRPAKGYCVVDYNYLFPLDKSGSIFKGWLITAQKNEEGTEQNIHSYMGYFRGNYREGKGIEKENDVIVYDGEFKNDKRHGKAIVCEKGILKFKGIISVQKYLYGHLIHFKRLYKGFFEYDNTEDNEPNMFNGAVYRYSTNIIEVHGKISFGATKKITSIETHPIKVIYKDETYFEGNFKEGKREGLGLCRLKNGRIIVGDWNSNKLIGLIEWEEQNKEFKTSQGEYIVHVNGDFLHTGLCKVLYRNNEDVYEGEMKYDKKHGYGKFIANPNSDYDKSIYIGEWVDGTYSGYGELEYNKQNSEGLASDIDKYLFKGDFEKGKRNGYGELFLNEKVIFKGLWKNDKLYCAQKIENGNIEYQGEIDAYDKYFVYKGIGCRRSKYIEAIIYIPTNETNPCAKITSTKFNEEYEYIGEVKDIKSEVIPDGYGKKIIKNDKNIIKTYIGKFANGNFEGLGQLINYQDNSQHEGQFKEGKKDGHGIITHKDNPYGYKIIGDFIGNKKDGRVLFSEDKRRIKYLFRNGKVAVVEYL